VTELVVTAAGWATTIQDGGRPGFGAVGVSPSGALDAPTRRLLNRLLGNPADAAVVETLGALRLAVTGPAIVASSAERAPVIVEPGDEISLDPPPGALWAYLAVRGGLAVEPVLGSRSTDSRSGLGPAPLSVGMHLPIGPDPGAPIVADLAPPAAPAATVVTIHPGPRADWFAPGALAQLSTARWTVSGEVSRVGMRLDGPVLHRRVTTELPSEGLLPGAVQVPPDGRPVVMLADHPATGGYPVLAVVDPADLAVIAQARPGSAVRFRLLQ
jgi:biotin-dependent carboxylase-like uncharacterized protein